MGENSTSLRPFFQGSLVRTPGYSAVIDHKSLKHVFTANLLTNDIISETSIFLLGECASSHKTKRTSLNVTFQLLSLYVAYIQFCRVMKKIKRLHYSLRFVAGGSFVNLRVIECFPRMSPLLYSLKDNFLTE